MITKVRKRKLKTTISKQLRHCQNIAKCLEETTDKEVQELLKMAIIEKMQSIERSLF